MNNSILSEDNSKELIIRFLQGKLKVSEETELLNWINLSKENEFNYLEYRNIWIESSILHPNLKIFDSETAWEKFDAKLTDSTWITINWYKIARIAAVLIVVFSLGAVSSLFLRPSNVTGSQQLCEIVTPLGARSQITLPDGTVVSLNAGSRLSYRKDFNEKNRFVSLEGEAFFKVRTNKEMPFIVNVLGIKVKALGTTFNVKGYSKDNSVVATLVEGIIKVEGKGVDQKAFSYTLKPNQNIVYIRRTKFLQATKSEDQPKVTAKETSELTTNLKRKDVIVVNTNINTQILTSWKDPRWIIEGEELENLATMFERRYNVIVHFKSEQLRNFKFSGTIENETLEQVLGILRLTTPLKYEIGKGEIWWDIDSKLSDKYSRILTKKQN